MKKNPKRYWQGKRGQGETIQWLRDRADHAGEDCLIWPFHTARGYGHMGYEGRMVYAHRMMCEIAHGAPPSPVHQAAHSCGRGNQGCVNPRHVSWKTPSANQRDKSVHGTAYRSGRRHKLKPVDVQAIRLLGQTRTQDELARMFGVSRRNIGAVLDGRSWNDVESLVGQSGSNGEK